MTILANRLFNAEAEAVSMADEIHDVIGMIRLHPASQLTQARRADLPGMLQHWRKHRANASLCRVLIAHHEAQRTFGRAAE